MLFELAALACIVSTLILVYKCFFSEAKRKRKLAIYKEAYDKQALVKQCLLGPEKFVTVEVIGKQES